LKFLLDNWILVLMAAASGVMLLLPALRGGAGGAAVGLNEAVRLINREKGVLIDVCEPAEYAAGHAAGAKNVPLGSLEDAKQLPSNKTLPIVLMCASGARAGRAASRLRKAGYEKAVAVAGGMGAWRAANFPIEKAEKGA
jgi:rhodanese-related sulfurtransferase